MAELLDLKLVHGKKHVQLKEIATIRFEAYLQRAPADTPRTAAEVQLQQLMNGMARPNELELTREALDNLRKNTGAPPKNTEAGHVATFHLLFFDEINLTREGFSLEGAKRQVRSFAEKGFTLSELQDLKITNEKKETVSLKKIATIAVSFEKQSGKKPQE